MKETRMPPAQATNLVANSGNTICGVGVIVIAFNTLCPEEFYIQWW